MSLGVEGVGWNVGQRSREEGEEGEDQGDGAGLLGRQGFSKFVVRSQSKASQPGVLHLVLVQLQGGRPGVTGTMSH